MDVGIIVHAKNVLAVTGRFLDPITEAATTREAVRCEPCSHVTKGSVIEDDRTARALIMERLIGERAGCMKWRTTLVDLLAALGCMACEADVDTYAAVCSVQQLLS